jgi:catechol 2,3-dioxygenase-like lactoylglutathione lyase family enzyme
MARVYTAPERLDAAIAFYERLFGEQCKVRFPISSLGLEIASVGSIHLIAGSEEKLKPFRNAQATFWVDSVAGVEQALHDLGSETLLGPEHGPGGSFMIVKHPDGLTVEYIDRAG